MRLDTGLIVELWNKGMLWDKLMGLHWLPLTKIHHSNKVSLWQAGMARSYSTGLVIDRSRV